MADTKTGTWLDLDTGAIVHSEPRRGRLLVAPGDGPTPEMLEMIDRYQANFETADAERRPIETATSEQPAAAKKASAKRSRLTRNGVDRG